MTSEDRAQVVGELLGKTYYCTVCKREEVRLRALPNLRVCLRCATPAQIVEQSDALLAFFADLREFNVLYSAVGGAKYGQILDEFGSKR